MTTSHGVNESFPVPIMVSGVGQSGIDYSAETAVAAIAEASPAIFYLRDRIRGQLSDSFSGYQAGIVEQINKRRTPEDKIEPGDGETLAREFED